ncbi:hypothetical protein PSP6_280106 [Paraburkholderia tropica]|nr:hypothetical protein PSP6_280106 [Paraburkholderia tropica]
MDIEEFEVIVEQETREINVTGRAFGTSVARPSSRPAALLAKVPKSS